MLSSIDTSIKKVTRIIHIADIHIRNLKRHTEYTSVFDKFFDIISRYDDLDSTVIYIAGDVAHAKTEMSPELVQMISRFLNRCASLCEVVLIPGNHDFNTKNKSRLDVLTPIVDALKNSRIHYIPMSGVYTFGNVNLVHYGIIDGPDVWPKPEYSEKNIGLFHGAIDSSETDLGFKIYDTDVTINTFEGCHAVLCGDIHKRQIITDGQNENPFAVYASSLIQQNYGEDVENHGFFEWNLSKDGVITGGDFVEIVNEYAHHTVDIDSGNLPDLSYINPKSRVRLRITNTPASELKLVLSEMRSKYGITNYSTQKLDRISKSGIGDTSSIDIGDVQDPVYQNTLIDRFYSDVDKDTIDEVKRLNIKINEQISHDDVVRNVSWRPSEFTFSNMFAYGLGNSVRFHDLNGIYGVFAPNATGKSAIFDALSFCLFDKCSRAFKTEHIKNKNTEGFECKLSFEIADITYVIERVAKKSGKSLRVDVDFYQVSDGEEPISLNGKDRASTNAVIRQYIGTYDDFITTSLSLQNNNTVFIDKKQAQRKDMLSQFMGIGVYDKLHATSNENTRELSAQIKRLKKDDHEVQLSDLRDKLKESVEVERELTKTTDKASKQLNECKERYIRTESLIVENDLVKHYDVEDLKRKLKNYKGELVTLNDDLKRSNSELNVIDKTISDLEEKIRLFDPDLESDKAEYDAKNKRFSDLSDRGTIINNRIKSTKSRIEIIKSEHEYDENCTFCVVNAKSHLELIASLKDELNNDTTSIKKILKEAGELKKFLSETTDPSETLTEKRRHEDSLRIQSNERLKIESRISRYEATISQMNSDIGSVTRDIETYNTHKEQIEKNARVRDELVDMKKELDGFDQTYKERNAELKAASGNVHVIETKIEACLAQIEELKTLEKEFRAYEFFLKAVNRDGIPAMLIAETLPTIESEVNNILQNIVDFSTTFTVDGTDINVNIRYDDSEWPLELGSGMERFISGLAIRVALMNSCSLPRSNFLVIDEGFSNLDSDNMSSMFMLFEYLRSQFDFIWVISHLDVMRDMVDHIVEIRQDSEFSYINY